MTKDLKKSMSMRGKAPKAGKGTGRKKMLPELRKEKTSPICVRLPESTIKMHAINSAWLFDVVIKKLEYCTGLNYQQPSDPEFNQINDCYASQKDRLIDLLSTESSGETVYKDEAAYEIVGILKSMGVIP